MKRGNVILREASVILSEAKEPSCVRLAAQVTKLWLRVTSALLLSDAPRVDRAMTKSSSGSGHSAARARRYSS